MTVQVHNMLSPAKIQSQNVWDNKERQYSTEIWLRMVCIAESIFLLIRLIISNIESDRCAEGLEWRNNRVLLSLTSGTLSILLGDVHVKSEREPVECVMFTDVMSTTSGTQTRQMFE